MSTESRQPTHHGYAINVKDRVRYGVDRGPLTDAEVEAIYQYHVDVFWSRAADLATDHDFQDIYSEGRSGGWLVPHPQPATDDMYEHELEAWVRDRFRPLERAVLALVEECREDFLSELAESRERAAAEPAERAYWEARDVCTVD